MNIFNSLRTGFLRSLKCWKGILIVWFSYLVLASFLAVPLSSTLKSSFGQSMITDHLRNGLDIEVFADPGANIRTILSFISPGLLFTVLIGFLLTAFLNGGLFHSLRRESRKFSTSEFFKSGAKYFWSFLTISILIRLLLYLFGAIFVGIPAVILLQVKDLSGNTAMIILFITIALYLLMLPVIFLVADYARAWQVTKSGTKCIKAIGFGFRKAFSKFRESYLLMALILIIQIFFIFLIFNVLFGWRPQTATGVFILFLISQILLYIRLALKTWRFASITASGEPYYQIQSDRNNMPDIV